MSEDKLLTLARSLVASGDLAGAEDALAARVKIHPIPFDALILLTEIRLRLNKGNQALAPLLSYGAHRDCADWLREYYIGERMNAEAVSWLNGLPKSGSVDDLIDQAALLQLSGDARSAAALCRRVLSLQPGNAFALNHLGRALFNTGMAADARQAFTEATRLAPGYFQAWHNLGHVLRAMNDFPGAEKAYGQALAIAPYYRSALLNLALLKMGRGENEVAAELLESLLAADPENADALLNLAICRHIGRQYDAAETAYRRAIAAEPGNPRAHRHLGNLYKELQDGRRAVDCYRNALALAGKDGDTWAELISGLEQLNDLDAAQLAAEEGLARIPDSPDIRFESAKIARRRGDVAEAERILSAINPNALHPRLVQAYHYECGTLADRMARYGDAFAAFSRGNAMAAESVRARATDRAALPAQIDAVTRWLSRGAPSASATKGDLGDDLCFLIGFPRSGTTLLDVMLDGHPQILSIEEKPTIERVAFQLDRLPGHYPFAMEHLDDGALADLRTLYRSQLSALRGPEHLRVIDKMPIRTIHAPFVHRLFPEASFLFAERHPCDVVLSNFMQQYAINEAMIHFTHLASSVEIYDRVMRLWQTAQSALPAMRVHAVRYESLLENAEASLRGTCDFLGLPWQEGIQDHRSNLAARTQIQTNSYHQVAEPVYQRSKFRWLNYSSHFEPYMNVLQPHIERMGY
ncbi:sulfotransferase [Arenimonas sp. GDDSR-1]|uniref:tetratricopeptide repeat-containing sulfotransferase family protein n=1 Tax=Arenimonas sp. GDDSR-1 TaxID=2950125 RepID=UPI0026023F03|nr:sulfotransferase [Arenimonas sp. GDDSR-1]